MPWLSDEGKQYDGMGSVQVTSEGKREIPFGIRTLENGKCIPGLMQCNQAKGSNLLLVPDDAQVHLGIAQGLRKEVAYFQDQNEHAEACRQIGKGIQIIDLSAIFQTRKDQVEKGHHPVIHDWNLLAPPASLTASISPARGTTSQASVGQCCRHLKVASVGLRIFEKAALASADAPRSIIEEILKKKCNDHAHKFNFNDDEDNTALAKSF